MPNILPNRGKRLESPLFPLIKRGDELLSKMMMILNTSETYHIASTIGQRRGREE